jgi:hypothetical protein
LEGDASAMADELGADLDQLLLFRLDGNHRLIGSALR